MLQIGTDTEYFVEKQGVITHAIGEIGGSKERPLLVDKGNLQEDNVLAEYAIDPVDNVTDFIASIRSVEASLEAKLRMKDLGIVRIPSYHFTKDQLLSWPIEAMVLGCSPDINAWTRQPNRKPNPRTTLRTAAGHVHFSYENPREARTFNIVRAMDYTLGLWSVLMDDDTDRRELYGKAGSCRVKAYGGEYRVLSNFWLKDDDNIAQVYRVTEACVDYSEVLLPVFTGILDAEELQRIINQSDREAAALYYARIMEVLDAKLQ